MSLSLGNSSAVAIPPAGTYVIYNRILSPTGQKLAISFNGQNATATVRPLAFTKDQLWSLRNFNGVQQTLSPNTSSSLQAAWGPDVVTVLPGGLFTWTFQSADAGVTIRDGGQTAAWALGKNQTNGSVVSVVPANDTAIDQKWILELQD